MDVKIDLGPDLAKCRGPRTSGSAKACNMRPFLLSLVEVQLRQSTGSDY